MKSLITLLFFWFLSGSILGQEPVLNESKWSDLKQEIQFSNNSTKKAVERTNNDNADGKKSPLMEDNSRTLVNMGPALQIIIVVLFIVFLVMLAFAVFTNVSFKGKPEAVSSNPEEIMADIENDFSKGNLEKWLDYARSQKDYYLILRVQFLLILKSLEDKHLIRWKKNKTNWDYINELSSNHYKSDFQKLVFDFDQVWYGEKTYSDEMLQSKIEHFELFNKRIKEK